ncbi:hypothetical protein HWV23_03400 [Natronomonas halophila]|uniref:hypothetical protein n=1 Tax=Natronomonas halophila TaxID=2747817 RepID=UPI0015B54274|nr:hypothetical protein [Natronomonas halophila]QLD84797.1 hypothetical protein HWV23_03400 [Natronomonas halophila]
MLEPFLIGVGTGFLAGYAIRGGLQSDEIDTIDEVLEEELQATKDLYASTEIDDEENLAFEVMILQRLGTERIMRAAVDVVGPQTALAIAKHFEGNHQEYPAPTPRHSSV